MQSLSEEVGRDLGTGYSHDPLSLAYIRDFIREHGKPPMIARASWITTQRILEEEKPSFYVCFLCANHGIIDKEASLDTECLVINSW